MSCPPTKGWEHEQSCKRKAAKNRGLVWRSNCCPNQFLYPLLLLSVRYHRRHETEKWICLQFWIGICVNICHFPVHQGSARFLVFNFSCKILTSFFYIFYNSISFFSSRTLVRSLKCWCIFYLCRIFVIYVQHNLSSMSEIIITIMIWNVNYPGLLISPCCNLIILSFYRNFII